MKTPHKHVELIKAWADGAVIEFYSDWQSKWLVAATPQWYPKTQYRIKPEPALYWVMEFAQAAGPAYLAMTTVKHTADHWKVRRDFLRVIANGVEY